MSTFHRQVYSHIVGAEVDEGMVEVLECLTLNGVKTVASCQGVEPCEQYPYGTDAYIAMAPSAWSLIYKIHRETASLKFVRFPSSTSTRDEDASEDTDCIVVSVPRDELPNLLNRWRHADVPFLRVPELMVE